MKLKFINVLTSSGVAISRPTGSQCELWFTVLLQDKGFDEGYNWSHNIPRGFFHVNFASSKSIIRKYHLKYSEVSQVWNEVVVGGLVLYLRLLLKLIGLLTKKVLSCYNENLYLTVKLIKKKIGEWEKCHK